MDTQLNYQVHGNEDEMPVAEQNESQSQENNILKETVKDIGDKSYDLLTHDVGNNLWDTIVKGV